MATLCASSQPPTTATTSSSSSSSFPAPSSSLPFPSNNLKRPRPIHRLTICHASLPPQSEPPPGGKKDPTQLKGTAAALAKIQDRVQIFFAVLFWMSLFFWTCAWDGKNKGSGRPNKGTRSRR